MYIYVHAAFLLNFILKNISPKKLIKDGKWYKLFYEFGKMDCSKLKLNQAIQNNFN